MALLKGVLDADGKYRLVLTDMTPQTVDLLLDWMYDTFNGPLTLPQAVSLFQAAHQFDIPELQQHCERAMKAFVSFDTCLDLADLALQTSSSTLAEVMLMQSLVTTLNTVFAAAVKPVAYACCDSLGCVSAYVSLQMWMELSVCVLVCVLPESL